MKTLEATEPAFEAANSTLFMLLGGLSLFGKMRRGLPAPPKADVRARAEAAGGKGDRERHDADSDPFTLALLGLIAAGQRLGDRCADVAKDSAAPSPAKVTPSRGRASGTKRAAAFRALLR